MEMMHTAIPEDELNVFRSLKNIRVVFDVGTRDDVDYLIIKPKIKLHCFEPNPLFFEQLKNNVGTHKNVYLNNWGVGEVEGRYHYDDVMQSTREIVQGDGVLVKRLDKYIIENKIKKIDFLKIDVEGNELLALKGLGSKIKMCRYIQLEGNNVETEKILKKNGFKSYYVGYSNTIAVRKGEKKPYIPRTPKETHLYLKTEKNYLK